ncbi:MAG: TonB family protein [Bryobacteraceae bacterium]
MEWRVWAELLIRSGIVLLACEGLRRFVRRTDPAARHRIGLFAFGLLAILPLLVALLPGIPIGNWLGARAIVTVETGPALAAGSAAGQGAVASIDWLLLVWAVGAAIGFGWLAAGQFAIWRLARSAIELRGISLSGCGRPLPEILLLDKPIVPMTFGMIHPKILLPSNCAEWTPSRWRAVLLHEMAHIRRRDVAAQLFAAVVCSLWWFQPLAWRERRNLREESERACDEQAMSAGMRASEYASELLAIAQLARRGVPSCAIGMAGNHLEARLHAILRSEAAVRSRTRGPIAILTLMAFATAASAITLGGSPMKRIILSGLLASASLSAATIGGTVLNPNGSAIPDATIVLTNPNNSAQQETMSAPTGKFSFEGLQAGQYIVRVKAPGFADLLREYTVAENTKVARALVMNTTKPPKTVRLGGGVMATKAIKKVRPVYPPEARANHVQGKVTIHATISKDGVPTELSVVSSPSPALSQSALDAVRQWRYRPVLLNGQPVAVTTEIRVSYSLTK